MFFGLKISDNQSDAGYTTFQNNVKLSQAVLEPNAKGSKNNHPVSIMVEHDNENYCLCVLTPGQVWQCPLDLLMEADMKVRFYLKGGSGTVHLTGYESPEFDMDDDSSEDELSDSEIESSDVSDIEIDDKNRVRVAKVPSKQVARLTPSKANTSKDGSFKSSNGRVKLNKREVAVLNKLGEKIDDDDDDTDSDDEDFDILNPDEEDDSDADEEDDDDDEDNDADSDDDGLDDDSDEEMSDEDMDDDSDNEYD